MMHHLRNGGEDSVRVDLEVPEEEEVEEEEVVVERENRGCYRRGYPSREE